MNTQVLVKNYLAPPVDRHEILHYAGCKTADAQVDALLNECISEAEGLLSYKVCYIITDIKTADGICELGVMRLKSRDLETNLSGCRSAVIFAATVGARLDRLISRYSHISPAKALMLQAVGTERIEALCDLFCRDVEDEKKLCAKPRFSAGYGDLPLSAQKDFFSLLDCERKIGLTLNSSLVMSPTKSVTAVFGLKGSVL